MVKSEMSLNRNQVNELSATISITASVGDWLKLKAWVDKDSSHPNWEFSKAIGDVIEKFRKEQYVFVERPEKKKPKGDTP